MKWVKNFVSCKISTNYINQLDYALDLEARTSLILVFMQNHVPVVLVAEVSSAGKRLYWYNMRPSPGVLHSRHC